MNAVQILVLYSFGFRLQQINFWYIFAVISKMFSLLSFVAFNIEGGRYFNISFRDMKMTQFFVEIENYAFVKWWAFFLKKLNKKLSLMTTLILNVIRKVLVTTSDVNSKRIYKVFLFSFVSLNFLRFFLLLSHQCQERLSKFGLYICVVSFKISWLLVFFRVEDWQKIPSVEVSL